MVSTVLAKNEQTFSIGTPEIYQEEIYNKKIQLFDIFHLSAYTCKIQ